ncbi:arsenate reductase ArsC [Rubrivivax sp. JA1026]|uniref:arsenate reductase ArsC n=1 Tax=Rubrivivax sp. JA1026 TaxID=2710888 RepID=UPI0013E99345|nr:arsenate reductase ArsC [Rubrivivax sp. JA1026]
MEPTTYNVLFVCSGNSARSILAEALMNRLGDGRFRAFSAGSHPKGEVHPLTLKTLAAQGLPVDGCRSKSWEEFASPGAPELHFVFTVCDQAAGEVCPVWPGQPITAHWGMPDPAAAPEAQREQAFVDTFVTMKRRIQLMLALPLASLDRVALKARVADIGKH